MYSILEVPTSHIDLNKQLNLLNKELEHDTINKHNNLLSVLINIEPKIQNLHKDKQISRRCLINDKSLTLTNKYRTLTRPQP